MLLFFSIVIFRMIFIFRIIPTIVIILLLCLLLFCHLSDDRCQLFLFLLLYYFRSPILTSTNLEKIPQADARRHHIAKDKSRANDWSGKGQIHNRAKTGPNHNTWKHQKGDTVVDEGAFTLLEGVRLSEVHEVADRG